MRVLLALALLVALAAASAAESTTTRARIWLESPSLVAGSGFHAGKVTVTAQTRTGRQVRLTRAGRLGKFSVRFDRPITYDACHFAVISAVGADGVRATTKSGGGGWKDCPPPIEP